MALLKFDEDTFKKLADSTQAERDEFIAKLSYPQKVKFTHWLQARIASQGLGAKKFPDPISMAIATKKQAWTWLEGAEHIRRLSLVIAAKVRAGKHVAIEMPPRQGKSTLCSVWTPAWLFAEKPKSRVMMLTYADTFAAMWGQTVRDLIQEFGQDWGLAIDPANTAKKDWKLTTGGFMLSAGIGGQVIGRGCDLLVCDDMMKEQDADSPLIREAVWKLFEGTALSRVEPGGSIIVIMQRFHEDDIIGRLERQKELKDGLGADFSFYRIPAIAEAKDQLGREEGAGLVWGKFTQEVWEKRRANVSPYTWSAIYQQRPSPAGGGHVLRAWFEDGKYEPTGWKKGELPPRFDKMIQTWDFTLKDKQTSDLTAAFVLGISDAVIYVLDGWIAHANIPQAIQQFFVFQRRWPRTTHKLVEDAAGGPAFIQIMRRRVAGIVAVKPGTSKLARLKAAAPAMESRNVLFPVLEGGGRPRWAIEAIEQLCSFPKAPHDDAVDALTQGINWLDPLGLASVQRAHQGALNDIVHPFQTPQQALQERFFKGAHAALQEHSQDYGDSLYSAEDLPLELEPAIDI